MKSQSYLRSQILLGNLPTKLFQEAVNEAANNTQAPPGMALMVALAAVSLATQGLVDVKMPVGKVVALALMILVIASSGERKTALEAIFFRMLRDIEALHRKKYEEEYAVYKRIYETWKVQLDVKKKKLKKKIEKDENSEQEAETLRLHLEHEPVPPVLFKLLYEDTTLPAMYQGLRAIPSAGLVSSEGGGLLSGPLFSEQTKLNALYSGSPVSIDRVSSESFVLTDVRLTVLAMVQPNLLKEFLAEKGEKARGSGLLARMLVCDAGTTQGTRFINNTTVSWGYCERFNQRIAALMEKNMAALKDPNFKRQVIGFSHEAEAEWLRYYNYAESEIRSGGRYAQAGDHASKLAENVTRVAAVLHCFEGYEGDISLDTLRAAISIVDAASFDFADVLIAPPQEFQEAKILDDWLTQKYRNVGQRFVGKSIVRKFCPNSLRNTSLLDHIVDILVQSGRISMIRQNKTVFLDLFPRYGMVRQGL